METIFSRRLQCKWKWITSSNIMPEYIETTVAEQVKTN